MWIQLPLWMELRRKLLHIYGNQMRWYGTPFYTLLHTLILSVQALARECEWNTMTIVFSRRNKNKQHSFGYFFWTNIFYFLKLNLKNRKTSSKLFICFSRPQPFPWPFSLWHPTGSCRRWPFSTCWKRWTSSPAQWWREPWQQPSVGWWPTHQCLCSV